MIEIGMAASLPGRRSTPRKMDMAHGVRLTVERGERSAGAADVGMSERRRDKGAQDQRAGQQEHRPAHGGYYRWGGPGSQTDGPGVGELDKPGVSAMIGRR